ncbi:MAG TPA: prepilin-type N-terminal cleavage/methylation domain-containing protein [Haliangiales bacterium]|nr:prepilin-type N-terminal cleavage/methylation domain-containing protein [Haliangiales bacterium]
MIRAQSIRRNASGFTLIELVISGALMALILVSAYFCLSAGYSSQKVIEPRADIFQNARVAMAIMSADLRAAGPLSTNYEFLGMQRIVDDVEADNLDFATHNYTPRGPREGDFCEISFFLDKDPGSGTFSLWRRRNPTIALDALSGGRREEIARGVRGLKFEYYDGFDWYDTWGDPEGKGKQQTSWRDHPNLSGMPDAVRITLLFDRNPRPGTPSLPPAASTQLSSASARTSTKPPSQENGTTEPPLVFQTVVRLNLAHSSQRGAAGGSSTGSDTTSQLPSVPGRGGGN